ncbi:MAG: AMP-binding protein, partial [Sphingopyxis sp.]|nr:AMP-binding protein [Sphingopyxis sp.]
MISHVTGASEPPLIEHTIGDALALAAGRWGARDALVSVGQAIRWSFADLLDRADAFAAGLLALGLEPGDRIGIWAPNCAEWTLTQFAAARAGMILVTINPAYRLTEVEYTINKVGLSALVAATSFKTSDYPAMIEELAPETAVSRPGDLRAARLPTLRSLILIGEASRAGWLRCDHVAGLAGDDDRRRLSAIGPTLDPNDAINIQFTSGTTGLPKGATLSHRNILN